MAYAIDGKLGVDFEKRTTTPEFTLGTTVRGSGNRAYVYVVATEVVATGTCTVTGTNLTDVAGNYTADTAFASGEYGFVRLTAADV